MLSTVLLGAQLQLLCDLAQEGITSYFDIDDLVFGTLYTDQQAMPKACHGRKRRYDTSVELRKMLAAWRVGRLPPLIKQREFAPNTGLSSAQIVILASSELIAVSSRSS